MNSSEFRSNCNLDELKFLVIVNNLYYDNKTPGYFLYNRINGKLVLVNYDGIKLVYNNYTLNFHIYPIYPKIDMSAYEYYIADNEEDGLRIVNNLLYLK